MYIWSKFQHASSEPNKREANKRESNKGKANKEEAKKGEANILFFKLPYAPVLWF